MMKLFTKGMDVLHDDRYIRNRHIGLVATNLINTVRGKSNIPLTHPPKPANQRIMPPHSGSQQPPPLARYRAFSLTWPASMLTYWNKRKHLHEKRVKLPEDFLGTPTWPPFHCFGTPIWPPWRRVKTLYTSCNALKNLPAETRQATPQPLLPQCRVFSLTWPASMQIYWNKRKRLHKKRDTNMAAVSLFWATKMATVTSCENTLYANRLSTRNSPTIHCSRE